MKSRKNGFLAFIFSFIPGAGEMYMGLFKQGLSLMGAFFAICVVASFLGLDMLLFFLPLLWFYSFFHVHHLRSLPPEDFYAVEDKFLFSEGWDFDAHDFIRKHTNVIAVVFIIVGVILLWNGITRSLSWILPDYIYHFISITQDSLPRIVVGILILLAGVKMIRGIKPTQTDDAYDIEEGEKDREEE